MGVRGWVGSNKRKTDERSGDDGRAVLSTITGQWKGKMGKKDIKSEILTVA